MLHVFLWPMNLISFNDIYAVYGVGRSSTDLEQRLVVNEAAETGESCVCLCVEKEGILLIPLEPFYNT